MSVPLAGSAMRRVDVVVPCYNYARYLRSCVESVLSQEGVEVRVLIIDDASTDPTPAVCASLARQDSRVAFRRHPRNLGHIATYNEGLLGWASADFSLLLSADDLLVEGALGRAAEIMEQGADIGLAYGLALPFVGDDCPDVAAARRFESRIVSGTRFLERCFTHGNPVPTPTAVVRTSVQKAIGGYDPALPHTADMEMWMRFAVHGRVGVVGAVQALYRKHDESMSTKYYAQDVGDRREVVMACDRIARTWGPSFPELSEWSRALHQRLACEAFWDASLAIESADEERFRSCLAFAEEACPEIRHSWAWRRLKVKRVLGRGVVSILERTLARLGLRRRSGRSPAAPGSIPGVRTLGWWPDSA